MEGSYVFYVCVCSGCAQVRRGGRHDKRKNITNRGPGVVLKGLETVAGRFCPLLLSQIDDKLANFEILFWAGCCCPSAHGFEGE